MLTFSALKQARLFSFIIIRVTRRHGNNVVNFKKKVAKTVVEPKRPKRPKRPASKLNLKGQNIYIKTLQKYYFQTANFGKNVNQLAK
jgi:hypothetical protein